MKKSLVALLLLSAAFTAGAANEVGSYPTASTLAGSERMLADQAGVTVDILPSQLATYLGTLNLTLPTITGQSGCLYTNGTGVSWSPSACGSGTITSIGLSMPPGFTVTNSPLTSSGTLTVTTTLSGLLSGTGTGIAAATAADVVAKFTGCSGSEYLGADGACHSAVGSGTVTSVSLAAPTWLTVTGSPITSSGTITLAGASALTTHQVLGTGTTGVLGLEALSAADLPSTITSNTTGNAASATALAAAPTLCTAGQASQGILANGNATGCFTPSGSGNVSTSGTTAQYDIPVFTNATAITGIAPSATVGEALISGGSVANPSFSASLAGVTSVNGTTIPAASTLIVSGGALGTPSSGTLTNATGLPFSGLVTGTLSGSTLTVGTGSLITSSGSGIVNANEVNGGSVPASATVLGSNASSQPVAATTTGTGSVVLATSPTLVTPNIGNATAGTIANSGAQTNSASGAASTAALTLSGAPYTAGTATTNYPLAYLNDGTAPTTWSTAGTEFGINAPTGFTGNFLDFHVNGGASVAAITYQGTFTGNAATATALAATPTTCSATQAATGILANGNATGCFTAGTVTDGSGTTTANEVAVSTATAHTISYSATLPTAAMPALSGDLTGTAGSLSVTVSKVNGATVPASANCLSSNGGSQLTPGCPEPTVQETGTSYTVDSTWCGSLYVFTSASAVAISLPEITNCQIDFSEQGAGGVTITPSAGDINGSTSAVTVAQNRQITLNYDSTDTNWGAIGATALVAGGSGQPQDIQTFTTGGTWTKPAWASSDATATTKAICLGAGGGGGSGGVEPAGTAVSGGGGGGGGAWAMLSFPTSSLPSTVSVTVGTAGTGGTAVAATGVGNNGGNGGSSSFGTYLTAYGGAFGQGGQNASASSGGGGAGLISGGSGSTAGVVCGGDGSSGANGGNATCATGGAGGAGDAASGGGGSLGGGAFLAGGGGPSGGGLTSADATSSGGSSRSVGAAVGVAGGAAGSAGGAGNAPSAGAFSSGSPGAGGGSSATGNGGAGGASAIGSGGAGGGAAENGAGSSGAGGTGGSGECWVVTTY